MAVTSGTPIALESTALTTVANVLMHCGLTEADLAVDGLTVYNTAASSETSATVTVDGGNLGVLSNLPALNSWDLTAGATDTIAEIVAAINTVTNFVAVRQTHSESPAVNLLETEGNLNCLGTDNLQYLQITDYASIIQLINQASALIISTLRRNFAQATYTKRLYATCDGKILLPEYPIISVNRLSRGMTCALQVKNTSSDAHSASVRIDDVASNEMSLQIVGGANAGTDTVDFATDATITAVVAAVNAIGKGWSAVVGPATNQGAMPSSWLLTMPARRCLGAYADVLGPEEPEEDYAYDLDQDGGILDVREAAYYGYGSSTGSAEGAWVVSWTAGYATIPDDITWAANQLIKELLDTRQRDTSLASERLGDYAWTARAAGSMVMSDAILERIGHYRSAAQMAY